MSLSDLGYTGRDRNVLAPPIETITVDPSSEKIPPFNATTSSFTLRITDFNILSPAIGAGGANSVIFTGTDGGSFSAPVGKNVIVKSLYIRLSGLAYTGTWFGYNWTAPILRAYRGGTTTPVSNSFPFTQGTLANPVSAPYTILEHFGWASTPAGGRRTLLAGESLSLGVLTAYSAGTSGFTFTILRGDAYAECLLVNA
jgi:hypothetical protein